MANPSPLGGYGDPNSIYGFALGATTWTQAYIQQLMLTSAGLVAPVINPGFPTIPTPPIPITTPLPSFLPITWNVPAPPSAFTGSLDIGNILPAPFDATPPTLAFPTSPTPFSGTMPDAPAVQLAFDFPTLNLTLPTPPNLLSINVQPFGGFTMPTAPSDPATLNLAEPTIIPYTPGAPYTSALLTTLQNKLTSWLDENGTALPSAAEQAIYDRAREREYRQMADALADLDRMESMGFALPPGSYLDARIKLQTEMQNTTAGLSRDIMIKQAELNLQKVSEAMGHTVQLEGQLIQYVNQIEQRNFEATKYATEAGIAIYNAKVQAYSAYLEAYKTKAVIYEAMVRAELAKVEAYKAEIEAEKLKVEIDQALVAQYDTMVRASMAQVEIYKAELGAIQTRADIEKTKVEIFGEQIKAYTGQVNAYTANIEAYKAQVQAEATKQEAFKAQVEAYVAQVDAGVKKAQALIEQFRAYVQVKEVEYEGYKATISAESARAQATGLINQTIAEAFKAEVGADSAYNELLTKQWQVALDEAERIAEVAINTAKMNAELYITTRQLAAEGAKVGAQVNAQLASAALNAIHWSNSYSNAYSDSMSQSISSSTSDNTNTNINL